QAGSPELFRTVGTRLLRGRGIEEQDRREAPPVAVVSDAMAKVLWPGKDPIGKCMWIGDSKAPCTRVVGIAENIKQSGITQTVETSFHYYLPVDQFSPRQAGLFVRMRHPAPGSVQL